MTENYKLPKEKYLCFYSAMINADSVEFMIVPNSYLGSINNKHSELIEDVKSFFNKYPDAVWAQGHEMDNSVLFSKKPEFVKVIGGDGVDIIMDAPKRIISINSDTSMY